MAKLERVLKKARALATKGKGRKALGIYREACELAPHDPELWLERAEVGREIADDSAAEDMFHAADLYARAGMPARALEISEKVLDFAPKHGGAKRFVRMLKDRMAGADKTAAKALGKNKPGVAAKQVADKKAADKAAADNAAGKKATADKAAADKAAADKAAADKTAADKAAADKAAADKAAADKAAADKAAADKAAGKKAAGKKAAKKAAAKKAAADKAAAEKAAADKAAAEKAAADKAAAEKAAADKTSADKAAADKAAADKAAADKTSADKAAADKAAADKAAADKAAADKAAADKTAADKTAADKTAADKAAAEKQAAAEQAAAARIAAEKAAAEDKAAEDKAARAAELEQDAIPRERRVGRMTGELALAELSLVSMIDSEDGEFPLDDEDNVHVVQAVAATVTSSPLLSELDSDLVRYLIECGSLILCPAGKAVFMEGETGTSLYLILEGNVEVERFDKATATKQHLATLRRGAFFGEMALLTNAPRSATVRAGRNATLLEVSRDAVRDLIEKERRVLKLLMRFFRARMVGTLLATSPLFEDFTPDDRRAVVTDFRLRELPPEHLVLERGVRSDGLYLVLAGSLVAFLPDGEGEQLLGEIGPGDVFGEMSLLEGSTAMACIRARSRSWVLRLPREQFGKLVSAHPLLLEQLSEIAAARRAENQTRLPTAVQPI